MQPVERALRASFSPPTTLRTIGRGKPFILERIDGKGIVLLLGAQRNYTPLSWACLEGVVDFLRARPGWVAAGGTYVTTGEQGTLDEYLKGCITRQTSRWVAAVLEAAGVVGVDKGPPLRVQLIEDFK
jgi:hypothetical protein